MNQDELIWKQMFESDLRPQTNETGSQILKANLQICINISTSIELNLYEQRWPNKRQKDKMTDKETEGMTNRKKDSPCHEAW